MRNYYSIPLLFFALAALMGLFLRWQFVHPTPGINFTYFVHGHSHVMFLGWVFNVLYLSSIEDHIDVRLRRNYMRLFLFLQALVFAMMISFPVQGYGAFSIAFSTAHTLAVMIFIPVFFRHANGRAPASIWFLKAAWVFFFLSTAGPFSLGYLMASGTGNTVWNSFSIYYYLHFQYNGFFLFGILGMFIRFMEQRNIPVNQIALKRAGWWLAVACVPAYFLSVLFADPPHIFFWLAAGGAALQLFALFVLTGQLRRVALQLVKSMHPMLKPVWIVMITALTLKVILQAASAHPRIAELTVSLRPVVIAYLHLVLVGIISLFLLGWYVQRNLLNMKIAGAGIYTLMIGFLGSEVALVLMPWWNSILLAGVSSSALIFVCSALMALGAVLLLIAFLKRSHANAGPSEQEAITRPEDIDRGPKA